MRRTRLVLLAAFTLSPFVALPWGASASADPLMAKQWALTQIKANAAWSSATGAGTVIAVLDTGVDKDHPELADKLVKGASFADCPAGQRPCDSWDDIDGHGTQVAGIAAAPIDSVGIAGVAPKAKIMPVRVYGADGKAKDADVADGIHYAVDNGADVINLSIGGLPGLTQAYDYFGMSTEVADAMDYAIAHDVVVVYAAGNEAAAVCDEYSVGKAPDAICVGAVDKRKMHAAYSNIGIGLDIVAPGGAGTDTVLCDDGGEGVISTRAINKANACTSTPAGYSATSGSSFAAPHVAGVAALLAQHKIRGKAAAARILTTAADLGVPGVDPVYGAGLLNARAAVPAGPPPTTTTSSTSTTEAPTTTTTTQP